MTIDEPERRASMAEKISTTGAAGAKLLGSCTNNGSSVFGRWKHSPVVGRQRNPQCLTGLGACGRMRVRFDLRFSGVDPQYSNIEHVVTSNRPADRRSDGFCEAEANLSSPKPTPPHHFNLDVLRGTG